MGVEQLVIALAWVLAGLGVIVLAWALFSDRARGRARCPRCWYDMAGMARSGDQATVDSHGAAARRCTCPECGKVIASESQLLRTRRHWRWVMASVVLFGLSYGAFVGEDVVKRGARAMIPGAVLVRWPMDVRSLVEPDVHPAPGGRMNKLAYEELQLRLEEHRLSRWQSLHLQHRLQAAYGREGRWGVTQADRETLARLEAMKHAGRTDETMTIGTLAGELASAGVGVDTRELNPSHRAAFASDIDADRPVRDVLDAMMGESRLAWTVDQGRVVIDEDRAIERQTRYMIVDLHDLAPIAAGWSREWSTVWNRPVNNSKAAELTATVTTLIDPGEWVDNGGTIASAMLIDEMLVLRARPSTIVKVEQLVAALRQIEGSRRHGVGEARIATTIAGPGANTVITLYDLSQLVEKFAEKPPATLGEVEQREWTWQRRRGVCSDAVDLLTDLFDMPHWAANGGEVGEILDIDTIIAVSTTKENHAAIADFLARLSEPPAQYHDSQP